MAKPGLKVLIVIFPGFNTLDLNGPLEVLKNSALPDETFTVYITAAGDSDLTKACEGVQIQRDIPIWAITELRDLKDLGNNTAHSVPSEKQVTFKDIDALIIPGARRWGIDAILESPTGGDGVLALIDLFAAWETTSKPRWIISICTGSELLAKSGVLNGKKATTHWAAIPNLQELSKKISKRQGVPDIEVQRQRWVDAGVSKSGVRLVTSGGISCGIDCMLWYVSQVVDLESAKKVALFMDYPWVFTSVGHTEGYAV